jgi:hypothetical protein
MAISDIPEFVRAQPGDLITAQNWDMVQKLTRESLRLHHHTRPAGTPPTDTDTTDEAGQIGTTELVDGAVTASKLAAASVNTTNLVNGAVATAQLADGAVTTPKLGAASVTSANLSFQRVGLGSVVLGPNLTQEILVQSAIPSSKTTIYFPTLAITQSTGSGISDITAQMVYRQAVGSTTIDLYVRLVNLGAATASIIWVVLTFS